MRYRIALAVVLLGFAPILVTGCRSTPEMRDVDESVTVLEKVETLSMDPLPDWVLTPGKYKHAEPENEYFAGIGFPRQTIAFALHSADEDAFASIAKYIGQAVAVKWQSAGEAKNLHGQQSIETVVEEFVKKTIAIAKVTRAKVVDTHLERVSAHYHGTQVVMYRAYRLYEVSRADLVNTGRESAEEVAEEVQRERDEIRREQLEKLENMLQGLSSDDFRL